MAVTPDQRETTDQSSSEEEAKTINATTEATVGQKPLGTTGITLPANPLQRKQTRERIKATFLSVEVRGANDKERLFGWRDYDFCALREEQTNPLRTAHLYLLCEQETVFGASQNGVERKERSRTATANNPTSCLLLGE